MMIKRWKK